MDDLNPLNKKKTYALNPDNPGPQPDNLAGGGNAERAPRKGPLGIEEVTRLAGHIAREQEAEAERKQSPTISRAADQFAEITRVLSALASDKIPPEPDDIDHRLTARTERQRERLGYDWIKGDPEKSDEVFRNITALEAAQTFLARANERPEGSRDTLRRKDEELKKEEENKPLSIEELSRVAEHLEKSSTRAAERGDEQANKDEAVYGSIADILVEKSDGVDNLRDEESPEEFFDRRKQEIESNLGHDINFTPGHLQQILHEADMYRRMTSFVRNAQEHPAKMRELYETSPEAGIPQPPIPDVSSPLIPNELSRMAAHRAERSQKQSTTSEATRQTAAVASILAEYSAALSPITGEALLSDLTARSTEATELYSKYGSNRSIEAGLNQRAVDLENALAFVKQQVGRNPTDEREVLKKLDAAAVTAADAAKLEPIRKELKRHSVKDEFDPGTAPYARTYIHPLNERDISMTEFNKRYTPEAQERVRRHLSAEINHFIETRPQEAHRFDTLATAIGNSNAILFQRIYLQKTGEFLAWNDLGRKSFSEFATKYLDMELPEGFEDAFKSREVQYA